MAAHVFDANVLKNFLAAGLIPTLAQLCSGTRYVPVTVAKRELARLRDDFDETHRHLPLDELVRYPRRPSLLDSTLQQHRFYLGAIERKLITRQEAEEHYEVMRDRVRSRLPAGTLYSLRGTPSAW